MELESRKAADPRRISKVESGPKTESGAVGSQRRKTAAGDNERGRRRKRRAHEAKEECSMAA